MNRVTIEGIISRIESQIAMSYGFAIQTSANDCLIDDNLKSQLENVGTGRAAVYFQHDSKINEIAIGLYLRQDLWHRLCQENPFEKLDDNNLEAYCILVEEISHFHLIVNRAKAQKTVSILELEWQGEIDKILLAGQLLLKQTGKPCFRQLVHLIFDQSTTDVKNQLVYEKALKYAANYWYKLLPHLKHSTAREQLALALREFRAIYTRCWTDKLSSLAKLG